MISQLIIGLFLTYHVNACTDNECKLEDNCKCSSTKNPIDPQNAPQLIALTIDESVVDNLFQTYWKPLLFDRKNPDGNPISGTFYVPHEYTDYERVQNLYTHNFEIGVHSITKNLFQWYWQNATLDTLVQEFEGQRQIISHFANIPIEDIIGGRTPQLQIQGDKTMEAYEKSGLIYDNSWPSLSTERLFPYTLDYESSQSCLVTTHCPTKSHPGFWIIPLTNIEGDNDKQCNSIVTCEISGTAREIADWLLAQVNRVRNTNKSPLNLRLDSYWFQFTDNSLDAFQLFLDDLGQLSDVFLVSQSQVLEWSKNPVGLNEFKTATTDRNPVCTPVNCELLKPDNAVRYMKSCVPCPAVYPWLSNPYGLAPELK